MQRQQQHQQQARNSKCGASKAALNKRKASRAFCVSLQHEDQGDNAHGGMVDFEDLEGKKGFFKIFQN